jgi:hypothetical protein
MLILGTVEFAYWQTTEKLSTGAKFGIAFGMGLVGGVAGYALSVTWESLKEGGEGFRSSDARTTAQIAKDKDVDQAQKITSLEGGKSKLTQTNQTLVKTNTDLQKNKTDLDKAYLDLATSKNETISNLQAENETPRNRLTTKDEEVSNLTTRLNDQNASHAEALNKD